MAQSTLSTVSGIMREVLLPMIRDQLYNEVPWLKFLERNTDKVQKVGRDFQVKLGLRIARNQSIGVSTGALPPVGSNAYDQFTITLIRMYGRVGFDGPTLNTTVNKSALASIMDEEMDGLLTSFRIDMNRMIQGDGSGAMCTILTADATADTFEVDDARYLEAGMALDSFADTAGTDQGLDGDVIEDVDKVNNVVILTANGTFDQYDLVFRADNLGLEATGLGAIVDDGSVVDEFQGQDRTATSRFNANLIDADGGTFSEQMIDEVIALCRRISGEDIDFIGSSEVETIWWKKLLQSERRQVNTTELRGGVKALSYVTGAREIAWFTDPYFPVGLIYLLVLKHLTFYEATSGPEWMQRDGAILNRVPDNDAYEAALYHYWNLGADRCNCLGRIENFIEP